VARATARADAARNAAEGGGGGKGGAGGTHVEGWIKKKKKKIKPQQPSSYLNLNG
jgi:nanoRNase/pAp phosphatase (c-di-AMP/oligoRNAs hydrolase)